MKPAAFDIVLGVLGPDSVVVNGDDVTDHVEAVALTARHGYPNEVRLALRPGADPLRLAGDGIVHVQLGDVEDAVVAFLRNVDPEQLEKAVVERMSWGDSSSFAVALDVLREMAADAGS